MKLLLDAHTLLWHAEGGPQLSPKAAALLVDPGNELFVSIATLWEIAIKVGLKKLTLSMPFAKFVNNAVNGYGLTVLPISLDDCAGYEALPFPLPKHRDPFDRLLIAQAIRNGFGIVGADSAFDAYGITWFW